jgi:membrane peptidoglycan carboxypeptidase
VLVQFQARRETVNALPREHALELVNFMRGVVDEGTGAGIRSRYGITADVAGKTGTTQENTDGWFIMMHPQLVAGARVGFNDKLTMGNWGQGARSALPIVGEVFQQALRTGAIDAHAEFPVPRTRARAPAEPPLEGEPTAEPPDLGAQLGPQLGTEPPSSLQPGPPPIPLGQPPSWPPQRQFEPQSPAPAEATSGGVDGGTGR